MTRLHEGRLWFSEFFAQAVKSVSLSGNLRTESLRMGTRGREDLHFEVERSVDIVRFRLRP